MRRRWLLLGLFALPAGVAAACGTFESESTPAADGGVDVDPPDGAGGADGSRPTDAGVDSAADATDPAKKRIFLSTSVFTGDLSTQAAAFGLTGDAAAPDKLCGREAAVVGLSDGGGRWVAYVSFGGVATPAARMSDKGARYDVTGAKIIPAVGSSPSGPIRFADGRLPDGGHAWTGTTNLGVAAIENCGGWTSDGQSGVWGDPTSPASWASSASVACSNPAHLYCLED